MSNKIFLINNEGNLSELIESYYDSEDLLQSLLSNYPALLAGGQIDEIKPRKWILVSREFGIPDKENSGNRWSLDHLFIDQEGIPTLVEVKRSKDTRIRREVIGQILDYASNAISYWSITTIISKFESTCEEKGLNPKNEISSLLDDELSHEEYWEKVETNLNAGKIRMLIVANAIPMELKRIIEFLNSQMSPAEILGLEIKQFINKNIKTLVPKVVGKTSKSDSIKRMRTYYTSPDIDLAEYYETYVKHTGNELAKAAKVIISKLETITDKLWFGGSGIEKGIGHSAVPTCKIDTNGESFSFYPLSFWTDGKIELGLQHFKDKGFFGTRENQLILIKRYNEVPGVKIDESKIFKRPKIDLRDLIKASGIEKFIEASEWMYKKQKNEM